MAVTTILDMTPDMMLAKAAGVSRWVISHISYMKMMIRTFSFFSFFMEWLWGAGPLPRRGRSDPSAPVGWSGLGPEAAG